MSKTTATMAMFDTVTGSNEGTEIELTTTSGDPSGVKIRILGPDSDEAMKADRVAGQRHVKLVQKGNSDRINPITDSIAKAVAVTVNWSGMPGEGGKERPFSKAEAEAVYTNYPGIRREVLRELDDMKNFTKALAAI